MNTQTQRFQVNFRPKQIKNNFPKTEKSNCSVSSVRNIKTIGILLSLLIYEQF